MFDYIEDRILQGTMPFVAFFRNTFQAAHETLWALVDPRLRAWNGPIHGCLLIRVKASAEKRVFRVFKKIFVSVLEKRRWWVTYIVY